MAQRNRELRKEFPQYAVRKQHMLQEWNHLTPAERQTWKKT